MLSKSHNTRLIYFSIFFSLLLCHQQQNLNLTYRLINFDSHFFEYLTLGNHLQYFEFIKYIHVTSDSLSARC
jgi:hypothetical protein